MKRFLIEDDAIDNEKLMMLPADTFRFWFQCLCIANRAVPRGSLPPVSSIAFRTRLTVEAVQAYIDTLISNRLVDVAPDDTMAVHDWDDYQHTERDWAAIKRAQREKKKGKSSGRSTPPKKGTSNGVHVDVHVDSPKTMSTDVHEVSTDKERKEVSPSEISLPKTKEISPQSTPLPPEGIAGGVVNDPTEVKAVCQWAETLVSNWGRMAEGACVSYPAGWVREACSIAHEAKYSRFKAVESILGRFTTQGGPDSAQAKANGKPPPRPATGPPPAPRVPYFDAKEHMKRLK